MYMIYIYIYKKNIRLYLFRHILVDRLTNCNMYMPVTATATCAYKCRVVPVPVLNKIYCIHTTYIRIYTLLLTCKPVCAPYTYPYIHVNVYVCV